jgi:hypothetical protein
MDSDRTPTSRKWSAERMAAMAANILLGHVNLPGWFLLLFAIFFAVPDWNEKVRFWLEIAKSSGGYMSIAANILLWQYFPQLLTSRRVLWSRGAWDRQAFEGEADCVDGAD